MTNPGPQNSNAPIEVELKLLAERGPLDPAVVATVAAECGITLAPPVGKDQVDYYLDDASRSLARLGAGLRMRDNGETRMLTLKLAGTAGGTDGTLHRREELEIEWDGALPDSVEALPELLRDRLAKLPDAPQSGPLHVLTEVANSRTRSVASAGSARAEVCLDSVAVGRGDGSRSRGFEELEIEILDAAESSDTAVWERFAGALRERLDLSPSKLSKLERALRMLEGKSSD